MAKRNRRRAFPGSEPEKDKPGRRAEKLIDTTSGVFGFFRDHGVRETIESIIVAVVLALMFRAYEAEAFIIPTGSMAPALQGEHMDVVCEECGYQYRAGASASSSTFNPAQRATVTKTWCPLCRHGMSMQRNNPDHHSNNGDRILVNKFVYDFQPPKRFDVIVFKNPNNGKQNYIKRLIGLPGDKLLIENGDIYNIAADENGKSRKMIVRKPIDKVGVMLQLVHDTNYLSSQFRKIDWPSRWKEWASPDAHWKLHESKGKRYFKIEADNDEFSWLRYRHLAPRTAFEEFLYANAPRQNSLGSKPPTEWDQIENGTIPPRIVNEVGVVNPGPLIRDQYEYNDRSYRYQNAMMNERARLTGHDYSAGSHWVGDLALECDLEIESDGGSIAFDLVEGGVHFQCSVDLATGEAVLSTHGDNGEIKFDTDDGQPPSAMTRLKGSGRYRVRYIHMDDMLYLWINDRYVDFNGSSYVRNAQRRPIPKFSESDPGDSEPLGVGAKSAEVRINRLKVLRDVFYVAPFTDTASGDSNIRNETGQSPLLLTRIYENPRLWKTPQARAVFDRPVSDQPVFELEQGQYFPMGDNSPASQDARIWDGPHYVDEDFLIGRAMFIYWPHSLNRPIRFFPNFGRMGFIR